jgi:hypothetical protein
MARPTVIQPVPSQSGQGIYNLPMGEGLSHDCENVSTDQTCVVSCGAGCWPVISYIEIVVPLPQLVPTFFVMFNHKYL